MSDLLGQILENLRQKQIDYEDFLKQIAVVAKQVQAGTATATPPALNTPGKRALFNNLGNNEALALKIDETVLKVKPDAYRGNQARENVIKAALFPLLGNDQAEVERIFKIIVAQSEY
jgi:type I restriction enzyme R subunit